MHLRVSADNFSNLYIDVTIVAGAKSSVRLFEYVPVVEFDMLRFFQVYPQSEKA